jgi:hypothetical protein
MDLSELLEEPKAEPDSDEYDQDALEEDLDIALDMLEESLKLHAAVLDPESGGKLTKYVRGQLAQQATAILEFLVDFGRGTEESEKTSEESCGGRDGECKLGS